MVTWYMNISLQELFCFDIANFFLRRCGPTRAMAYSFLRFLDHTQRRTTVGTTPLDEWSARRRDWYRQLADYILIIKPTRCTNFTNLFLEQNAVCFGEFLCPSSGVFHCTHSNGLCHTACNKQDQDVPSWFCLLQAVWHKPLLCVQWKTPDDGQRNSPKHTAFCSKNKFVKLVHLVGFIIRIYHDVRSTERQIPDYNVGYSYYFSYSSRWQPNSTATFHTRYENSVPNITLCKSPVGSSVLNSPRI